MRQKYNQKCCLRTLLSSSLCMAIEWSYHRTWGEFHDWFDVQWQNKNEPLQKLLRWQLQESSARVNHQVRTQAGFAVPLAGFKLPPCVLEGITNILNPTQQIESKLLPYESSMKHHQSLKAQPSVRSMFFWQIFENNFRDKQMGRDSILCRLIYGVTATVKK